MSEEWSGQERRNAPDMSMLTARLEILHNDVSEIKGAMGDLTRAIMKLALIEERIGVAAAAQERAFAAISKLEARVFQLEQKAPINDQTSVWVDRGITATVGAFLMFLIDKWKS